MITNDLTAQRAEMNCPNCTGALTKNTKKAEGVWDCQFCLGTFFILITTKPTRKVEFAQNDDLTAEEFAGVDNIEDLWSDHE